MAAFPQLDSGVAVLVFSQGDDPILCLNKAMAFLTVVASSRFPSTNNQLQTFSNPRNQATIQDGRVTVQQVQGRQGQSYAGTSYKGDRHMAKQCTQPKRPRNAAWFKEKIEDLDAYDSDCDDVSNEKAVLMANLSNYGSDIISEVPHSELMTSNNVYFMASFIPYSKRYAFWSLNEDILKITILKTNTPYPSRKIRRIRACTHQRP
ncbi:hypothetical protein Tco_1165690 [Tanacetum coccineum]